MGAERKYTDRDVRENLREVTELVTNYLLQYSGEFDFLIDCKMRVEQTGELAVGMMRGVMNCMRVDPRYKEQLPDMLPEQPAQVIQMPRKWGPRDCDLLGTQHQGHYIGDEAIYQRRHWCSGWYEIVRAVYVMPAKVNEKYVGVVTRSGSLIHRLNGEAEIQWFANHHESGFYQDPDVTYLTCCKGASKVRNAFLLTEADIPNLIKDRKPLDDILLQLNGYPPPPSQRKTLHACQRCWQ